MGQVSAFLAGATTLPLLNQQRRSLDAAFNCLKGGDASSNSEALVVVSWWQLHQLQTLLLHALIIKMRSEMCSWLVLDAHKIGLEVLA